MNIQFVLFIYFLFTVIWNVVSIEVVVVENSSRLPAGIENDSAYDLIYSRNFEESSLKFKPKITKEDGVVTQRYPYVFNNSTFICYKFKPTDRLHLPPRDVGSPFHPSCSRYLPLITSSSPLVHVETPHIHTLLPPTQLLYTPNYNTYPRFVGENSVSSTYKMWGESVPTSDSSSSNYVDSVSSYRRKSSPSTHLKDVLSTMASTGGGEASALSLAPSVYSHILNGVFPEHLHSLYTDLNSPQLTTSPDASSESRSVRSEGGSGVGLTLEEYSRTRLGRERSFSAHDWRLVHSLLEIGEERQYWFKHPAEVLEMELKRLVDMVVNTAESGVGGGVGESVDNKVDGSSKSGVRQLWRHYYGPAPILKTERGAKRDGDRNRDGDRDDHGKRHGKIYGDGSGGVSEGVREGVSEGKDIENRPHVNNVNKLNNSPNVKNVIKKAGINDVGVDGVDDPSELVLVDGVGAVTWLSQLVSNMETDMETDMKADMKTDMVSNMKAVLDHSNTNRDNVNTDASKEEIKGGSIVSNVSRNDTVNRNDTVEKELDRDRNATIEKQTDTQMELNITSSSNTSSNTASSSSNTFSIDSSSKTSSTHSSLPNPIAKISDTLDKDPVNNNTSLSTPDVSNTDINNTHVNNTHVNNTHVNNTHVNNTHVNNTTHVSNASLRDTSSSHTSSSSLSSNTQSPPVKTNNLSPNSQSSPITSSPVKTSPSLKTSTSPRLPTRECVFESYPHLSASQQLAVRQFVQAHPHLVTLDSMPGSSHSLFAQYRTLVSSPWFNSTYLSLPLYKPPPTPPSSPTSPTSPTSVNSSVTNSPIEGFSNETSSASETSSNPLRSSLIHELGDIAVPDLYSLNLLSRFLPSPPIPFPFVSVSKPSATHTTSPSTTSTSAVKTTTSTSTPTVVKTSVVKTTPTADKTTPTAVKTTPTAVKTSSTSSTSSTTKSTTKSSSPITTSSPMTSTSTTVTPKTSSDTSDDSSLVKTSSDTSEISVVTSSADTSSSDTSSNAPKTSSSSVSPSVSPSASDSSYNSIGEPSSIEYLASDSISDSINSNSDTSNSDTAVTSTIPSTNITEVVTDLVNTDVVNTDVVNTHLVNIAQEDTNVDYGMYNVVVDPVALLLSPSSLRQRDILTPHSPSPSLSPSPSPSPSSLNISNVSLPPSSLSLSSISSHQRDSDDSGIVFRMVDELISVWSLISTALHTDAVSLNHTLSSSASPSSSTSPSTPSQLLPSRDSVHNVTFAYHPVRRGTLFPHQSRSHQSRSTSTSSSTFSSNPISDVRDKTVSDKTVSPIQRRNLFTRPTPSSSSSASSSPSPSHSRHSRHKDRQLVIANPVACKGLQNIHKLYNSSYLNRFNSPSPSPSPLPQSLSDVVLSLSPSSPSARLSTSLTPAAPVMHLQAALLLQRLLLPSSSPSLSHPSYPNRQRHTCIIFKDPNAVGVAWWYFKLCPLQGLRQFHSAPASKRPGGGGEIEIGDAQVDELMKNMVIEMNGQDMTIDAIKKMSPEIVKSIRTQLKQQLKSQLASLALTSPSLSQEVVSEHSLGDALVDPLNTSDLARSLVLVKTGHHSTNHIVHEFVLGSLCNSGLLSTPRYTQVRYFCDPTAISPRVSRLEEIIACRYVVDVYTNVICEMEMFREVIDESIVSQEVNANNEDICVPDSYAFNVHSRSSRYNLYETLIERNVSMSILPYNSNQNSVLNISNHIGNSKSIQSYSSHVHVHDNLHTSWLYSFFQGYFGDKWV